ncbi:MAG: hypothetical protein ACF788_06110 [Novipirellula sp. JB048]
MEKGSDNHALSDFSKVSSMTSGVVALMLCGVFGCHLNPSARLAHHGLLADRQFGFTLDDLNYRRQRGGMFGKPISSDESEQYNFCIVVVGQHDALLAGIWWLKFIGKLPDLIVSLAH